MTASYSEFYWQRATVTRAHWCYFCALLAASAALRVPPMKILATDAGFGYTKATDGRQHQLFKSILGEANTAQFGDALVSARSEAPRHFQLGDEAFFVGDWAETQSRGRRFTLDPAQFLAKHAKQLILAAIAPYAPDGEPIRLVTGLPISFFRRYREALTALLKGRHALTVFDAQGARLSQQV